jgi:pyruvate/2-oxoglutarate dehydrogenase complex dihydrolipoamide acyltransferase (E2) component
MSTEFKLPDLGENIDSGDIVSLLVKEGDVIRPQQEVLEMETEKAVIPVPCSIGGRVAKIFVKPGQTVKVGQTLLSLDEVREEGGSRRQTAHRHASQTGREIRNGQAGREIRRDKSSGRTRQTGRSTRNTLRIHRDGRRSKTSPRRRAGKRQRPHGRASCRTRRGPRACRRSGQGARG